MFFLFQEADFARRLTELQGDMSDRAFAKKVGITPTSLKNYLQGQTPGVDKAIAIAAACNVSVQWLLLGIGPKYFDVQPVQSDDVVLIPKLDVRASAGNGSADVQEQVVDTIAFPKTLVQSSVRFDNIRAVTAVGDSMEPTIASGDLLLVDTAYKRIRAEAIYVLVVDGETRVKRAQKRLNGSILISSDNPRYPPEEFTDKDAEKLQVAGRVVWFGRSI